MDKLLPTTETLLTDRERAQLREMIRELGERAVCTKFGISKYPLARLVGGMPVLRSTVRIARDGIRGFHRAER